VEHDPSSYVLVVDDEAVVREFLRRCLEAAGYRVKQAGDAEEAIEIMKNAPAKVVLCDIRMPGHDGLWLAERLRASWPRTAIVMATAIDDRETVRRSSAAGAVDYLTKPIAAEHLLRVVGRAMQARSERGSVVERAIATPLEIDLTEENLEKGIEAEYALEHAVRCTSCREMIKSLKAVRVMRSKVNFTSTLPRRGRIVVCPRCLAILPVELGNF
jgi:CheY-like chemotaxis protein